VAASIDVDNMVGTDLIAHRQAEATAQQQLQRVVEGQPLWRRRPHPPRLPPAVENRLDCKTCQEQTQARQQPACTTTRRALSRRFPHTVVSQPKAVQTERLTWTGNSIQHTSATAAHFMRRHQGADGQPRAQLAVVQGL